MLSALDAVCSSPPVAEMLLALSGNAVTGICCVASPRVRLPPPQASLLLLGIAVMTWLSRDMLSEHSLCAVVSGWWPWCSLAWSWRLGKEPGRSWRFVKESMLPSFNF